MNKTSKHDHGTNSSFTVSPKIRLPTRPPMYVSIRELIYTQRPLGTTALRLATPRSTLLCCIAYCYAK